MPHVQFNKNGMNIRVGLSRDRTSMCDRHILTVAVTPSDLPGGGSNFALFDATVRESYYYEDWLPVSFHSWLKQCLDPYKITFEDVSGLLPEIEITADSTVAERKVIS